MPLNGDSALSPSPTKLSPGFYRQTPKAVTPAPGLPTTQQGSTSALVGQLAPTPASTSPVPFGPQMMGQGQMMNPQLQNSQMSPLYLHLLRLLTAYRNPYGSA